MSSAPSSPSLSQSTSPPSSPAVAAKKPKRQYSEATWPDPTAPPHASPQVDDVSRLNATDVERVFEVRTSADIKAILRCAAAEGRQVSVRGTQHSMGGHTIAPGGFVLDMRHFDRLAYDPATELVSAGTGAHWTDLIHYLNQFGLSPRTMQSYSSFSVGGTVSVNAHGITTDHCLAESIVSFTLITADAREVVCSRTAEADDARELFSLAIGGYGLFGIITEVMLRVNPNLHLELDLLRVAPKDFGRVYRSLLAADPDKGGDVDIKMARLDITNLEHIELYVFRRASPVQTVSPLDLKPREMSLSSRLIYKWLAPTLQELRFTVERTLGTAFDWSQTNERNALMYESAVPLARLYSPLLHIDDTFILQEYFVPQKSFLRWVEQAKPIYRRIAQHSLVSLLNTTIRFVYHDTETALAYSRSPEGVYAFVLYYRIRRTAEADEALRRFHEELTEVTLSVRGTFYLPYRHHYSFEQLEQAYGRDTLLSFLERKEKYDPGCLFSSLWLRKYGSAYASDAYRQLILSSKSASRAAASSLLTSAGKVDASFEMPLVSERRTDSYRRLFHNALLRRQFLEEFLVHVFNIEDPSTLFRLISQAVWEPDNVTDLDVYAHLQAALATENAGPVNMLKKTWRQLKQLREQKDEIARETVSIMSRLGKIGQLHDYVSIGDNGKMVLPLREALGMRGQVWVVHDVRPESSEIPVVLERGSVEPLGHFVLVDYQDVTTPGWAIPDESADLVTMNQGLHHLPQTDIMKFLGEVRRILRPGGLFIVREHNARPVTPPSKGQAPTSELDLIPMLDLAHSVFNAVTGVSLHDERNEVRAFRSVLAWREIIEAAGLVDTMVYEVQADDPTVDEMMCFYKPPFTHYGPRDDLPELSELQLPAPPPFVPVLANLFKQIPATALDVLRTTIEGLITNLPSLASTLLAYVGTTTSPGASHVIKQAIDRLTAEVTTWLERFRPFIESSDSGDDAALNFLPPELFLIVPALNKRVALGTASPMEMVAAAILHDLQVAFAAGPAAAADDNKELSESAPASISTRGFTSVDVTQKLTTLTRALPGLLEQSVLDDIEVPPLAQRAIRSFLAASASAKEYEAATSGVESPHAKTEDRFLPIGEGAVKYLDLQAWKELSTALDEITKRRVAPPPLHAIIAAAGAKESLRGTDSAAVWARALSAVLGSPLVYLTRALVFQLRLVGIDGVYKAWDLAQKRRKATQCEALAGAEDEESANPLLEALRPFTEPPTNDAVMEEGHFVDIHNVAEVVSATFGYTSITARPTDVTAIIARRLKNNTLRLADLSSSKLQKQREVVPLLGLDRLRKAVTLNVSELKIRYRPVLETDPTYQRKVDELLLQLSESGWVKPLHRNDGHFTWFKLPEWMQVEMVQIFGESMNHTPWYRFPFMPFIKLYFEVLLKEVGIVRSEHGLVKALFSNAFLTDLIPGVVMFGLFLQLQLLALPVKSIGGEEYTPELMVEQVVLLTPPAAASSSQPIAWRKIDKRISAQQVAEGEGLYILTVPTFKPLTEILRKIASKLPQSQVLEISNQRVVQVKVLLPASSAETDEDEAALQAKLGAITGCAVMFTYRFPVDGSSASSRPRLCVSLRVATLAVVRLFQVCAQLGVSVEQVYDFYA